MTAPRPGRRRLVRALGTVPAPPVTTGVVTAFTATTVTVAPDPDDTADPLVLPFLAHYSPANDDVVLIYRAGPLAVVIGKFA